jgi:hypothetical protein
MPPGDTVSSIAGYQLCDLVTGSFGGLHDAEMAESPGEDPRMVRGDEARAHARFRHRLSS